VRRIAFIASLACVFACISGSTSSIAAQSDSTAPAKAEKPKHDDNHITTEEIAASKRPTAYEVVDRLRPQWLRKDMLTGEDVVVYRDEQNLGGSDKLRDMPSVEVADLQYVPHADAVKRWGSDIKGSVIVVTRSR
jgi:hypothetical protein